jgi:hypothetical protein
LTNLELEDNEIKSLIDILGFSLEVCPIESVGQEIKITRELVANLIIKLEKSIERV